MYFKNSLLVVVNFQWGVCCLFWRPMFMVALFLVAPVSFGLRMFYMYFN